jgi:predicted nucleic acid-binding protein
MGKLSSTIGKRVYCDANIFIYTLEGYAAYADLLQALLQAMDSHELIVVTSELTIAEVLVKPLRDGDKALEQKYRRFLTPSTALELWPLTRVILERAAETRAHSRMKLPDALHWTTALQAGCDSFLTNDNGFKAPPGLTTHLLSDLMLTLP